ncbi:MAG: hydrolase [Alkalibacterium sp.]|nr:hydrolase [Alkalibacterium sp.]
MEKKKFPSVKTDLYHGYVEVPEVIRKASGILINGKRFKAFLFTTDIALIMNNDADAIMAVYPFTPHPAILQAITSVSTIPVMAGIAGGKTQGVRSANMALFAEAHGCKAVVVNAPTPVETIRKVNEVIDIPIILTVVSEYTSIEKRLKAGVDIINVSGASRTTAIVRELREKYPELPIIATGGPTEKSILETIEAGANAITYTPPTNGELFSRKMMDYRAIEKGRYEDD